MPSGAPGYQDFQAACGEFRQYGGRTNDSGAFMSDIEQLCINTIRTLAMDAVQLANSGHPGTPMGAAPVAYTLWNKKLRFDPADPVWPNRDRFVLSSGHASMLLYALLHLTRTAAVGNDHEPLGKPTVTLDDIKQFRQLDSRTPGHPEYHMTSGVEVTTGPLGQGVANSVGMAIAERYLALHPSCRRYEIYAGVQRSGKGLGRTKAPPKRKP